MILYILIGLLVGVMICYLFLSPKVKSTQELDKNIELENQKNKLINEQLEQESNLLSSQIQNLEQQYESERELLEIKLKENAQSYLDIYHKVLEESAHDFTERFQQQTEDLNNRQQELDNLRSLIDTAVRANIRAQEIKEQTNFYRLNLSDVDIEEIAKLRTVVPYLRDALPLNKVIWKTYYERPYTDLVGRVIGTESRTGIYKITNLSNGMCYVGQAVDFAKRWKQHVLCGIGADTSGNNKLYPAMMADGVENFTFEIIEDCEREQLSERERFWQDYFQARSFGYSIK